MPSAEEVFNKQLADLVAWKRGEVDDLPVGLIEWDEEDRELLGDSMRDMDREDLDAV